VISPFDTYVGSQGTVPMYATADASTRSRPLKYLLWGDGVRHLDAAVSNGRRKVRARATTGWVDQAHLLGQPLLELYSIDVGQGDGVLLRTPDFRHLLIDGGYPRSSQPSGKSAADFVDWKFARDYGHDTIRIDALIASHNDHDHYGGLDDLLDVAQTAELDAGRVTVEHFFHAGLSWWKTASGGRTLGPRLTAMGGRVITQLLGDRVAAEAATGGTGPQLQGAWGSFMRKVVAARTAQGTSTPITRLSHASGLLPGFEGGDGGPVVRVLGPVERSAGGLPGLAWLGSESLTTNGQSLLLRVDYGRCRILLTGDLNQASQQALMKHYEGDEDVFACDVAKCCHHGSEDVSFAFLQAMKPAATIISSGDAEGHDHPRPRIVAASGLTGYQTFKNDQMLTPLVYSTEIARSLQLGEIKRVVQRGGASFQGAALNELTARIEVRKPGQLRPVQQQRRLGGRRHLVAGLVYGLVNVRTDGRTVLCATLNEGDGSWTIKTFKARF